jgi:hypothetical protein
MDETKRAKRQEVSSSFDEVEIKDAMEVEKTAGKSLTLHCYLNFPVPLTVHRVGEKRNRRPIIKEAPKTWG